MLYTIEEPDVEMYEAITMKFREFMIKELKSNWTKGDRIGNIHSDGEGWLNCDNKFWLNELYYHVGKLQAATAENNLELIKEYTADVANLALMMLDCNINLMK